MSKTVHAKTLASFLVFGFPFSAAAQITCGQDYMVVSGDTLSEINMRAYGTGAFSDLHQANIDVIGRNPNLILVGQKLRIPCRGDSVVAANTTAPSATVEGADESAENVTVSVQEPLVFTFNKTSAPKFIINDGIIDIYLAEIAEVTDGRVQFIDPPVMNRDPKAQLDLVTSGAVDGAYIFNGYLADSHPLLQLPMIPLMGGSAEQTAVSLWNLHANYLADTDYFDEAQVMGFVAAPAAHIWRLSSQPVALNADIADMNNYAVPYFEGLDTRGPAAVRAENEMALMAQDEEANGTLTFFMAHGAARAAGVWTEDRTVTEVDYGLYTPTFSVVLSHEAWRQISAEDQAAITAISGEYLAHRSASWDVFDNGHRLHMLDTGLNVVKADMGLLAELDDVAAVRVDGWVAQANAMGVAGRDAVDAYQADLDALQDRLLFR
ncbi:MAG: hypothetical protein AAF801_08640 [Pseudomonadota bacterium]